MGYTTIVYNGITIRVLSMTAIKVPATRKQKVGQQLIQTNVFTNLFDYQITMRGRFVGSSATLDTNRSALEASQDNFKHAYTDGISAHAGDYIITNLAFIDDGNSSGVTYQDFDMTILQDQYEGGSS